MKQSHPRNHHYVPRFLISRFANEQDKVNAYDRDTGRVRKNMDPKRVLIEKDLYRAKTKNKEDEYTLEHLFSEGEARWAPLIREIVKTGTILQDQIPDLIEFLAVQAVRTRLRRINFQRLSEYLTTGMVVLDLRQRLESEEFNDEQRTVVENFITDVNARKWRLTQPPSNMLVSQIKMLPELVDVFSHGWHYIMVAISHPNFVLTDDPIAKLGDWDGTVSTDIGIETAQELWMPLDPSHALVLTRDFTLPRYIADLQQDHVRKINQRLVFDSLRWTIYNPDIDPLQGIDIPSESPKLFIDEFAVPELGKEQGESILQFGRVRPHVENEQLLSGRRLVPFPRREHNYLEKDQVWIPDEGVSIEHLPINKIR